MKTKRICRIYHFSDARLLTVIKQKLAFMQRDAVHFAGYGITQSHFDILLQKAETFYNWQTTVETRGRQMEITQIRNAKRQQLTTALENVKVLASLTFKKGTARYKAFHNKRLALLKESEMYIAASVIAALGTKYLSDLGQYGLTEDMLDEIAVLNTEYSELILSQQLAQSDAVENNTGRILFGNEIYAELSRYTTLGMAIWESKSTARYNDYLIYSVKNNNKAA